MKRQIVTIVFVSAVFTGRLSLDAQSQGATHQPEETTVVGCLQKGTNAGEFVLITDEKTTYQIQAVDAIDLASHVDHRVELSGSDEMTESTTIFKAKTLKMVSTLCESPPGAVDDSCGA